MNGRTPLQQETLAYLSSHHVMTLATSGADGIWAAAVFYVNEGFDLFFLSAAHTRHAQHIAANAQAAVTIQEDYEEWSQIQGIQCSGQVLRLQGEEERRAVVLYRARFSFLRHAPEPVLAAFTRVSWYRLRPDTLFFVDNRKGFGRRDQIL